MLKLNVDKMEVLFISTPFFTDMLHKTHIIIGDASVQASESALGVIFDNSLEMLNHINTVCRVSFMQLRHLKSIKGILTQDSSEKVTHAFISSWPDYCNDLLYGLPQMSIFKLQRIQNVAARLLMGSKKLDHITSVLKSFH